MEEDAPKLALSSSFLEAAAAELPDAVECSICYDDIDAAVDVACENNHQVCLACFERHVISQSDTSVGFDDMLARDGFVYCWERPQGCASQPFEDQFVATKVSKSAFKALMDGRKKMLEFKIRQEASEMSIFEEIS
jgi:hypothetical protein